MKYLKEIRFRLTQEEKSTLIAMSEKANMSQSMLVRHLINKHAKKNGLTPKQSAGSLFTSKIEPQSHRSDKYPDT